MSPQEALEIGLVDKLIEPENFQAEVMQFAQELAAGAGKALGYIKLRSTRGSTFPWSKPWPWSANIRRKTARPMTPRKG